MTQNNTSTVSPHTDKHRSHRAPWLRAAVLGANDGVVSTSSLMLGVLAASQSSSAILTAGVAGLVAGALSMAAGEYVSVSSQRDSEKTDIEIERKSLRDNPDEELSELAQIYQSRGLEEKLAQEVAKQLHAHDAVSAHARDELGINNEALARPTQAAVASAVAFSFGAIIPIVAALLSRADSGVWAIAGASIIALAAFGAIGAHIGGGHRVKAAVRVLVGGGLAMIVTYYIGHLIGTAI